MNLAKLSYNGSSKKQQLQSRPQLIYI